MSRIVKKIFLKLLFVILVTAQLAFFGFGASAPQELNLGGIKRISRACYLIQHEYYDKSRIKTRDMLEEGFFELAKEVPEVLPKFDNQILSFTVGTTQTQIDLSGIHDFYDILYPVSIAFDFVAKNYHGDVKPEDMEYAFISGMLEILDPHSAMFPPKAYEEFKTQTSGQYGGLGIVIGEKDYELTAIAIMEDTPAWRGGVKADDRILQIGRQATVNMTLSDAVDFMRGAPNTKVTLKVQTVTKDKDGKESRTPPRDVELTREIISVPSVQTKLVVQDGKKIGIVRLKGFQEDTYADMVKGLATLTQAAGGKLDGIVLDLRNNPGGLLDQAILIADQFLQSGDIVYTEGADEIDEEVATAKKQDTDVLLPTMVLINEGSASASEIVAGALKNNNRVVVMGKKSFGKGSVQSLYSLHDGSSLKLTVAQYLTPGRVSIQAEGITPDIHLYPSLITADNLDLRENQDFSEKKLDSHLENTKRLKTSSSWYDMTYLQTSLPEIESQYTSKIRLEEDYPLQLAAKLLAHATSASKQQMLLDFKPVLDKESQSQDPQIATTLKQRGVDWSLGQTATAVQLEERYQFVDEAGNIVQQLPASLKIKLKVFIKNTGTSVLNRVMAETTSFNPLLDNKEFVFGKINPGQEVESDLPITVPSEIINFKEDVALNIYTEKTEAAPIKKLIATHFVEKTAPDLTYSYQLYDGNGNGSVGNSNSIPEKGEKIALVVKIKNVGPGVSEKTIVNLQNTEGDYVFLSQARQNLGLLKPNDEATANLAFEIKDNFDKADFNIKLAALDDNTKASIADTLTFNAAAPKKMDPKPGEMQVTPRIEVSAATTQIKDKYKIVATVLGDAGLKDIAIFVKGKKLFYDNLQGGTIVKSKVIAVDVPLEDGLNTVVIQARGARDLINQKNLSVVYSDENKVATP